MYRVKSKEYCVKILCDTSQNHVNKTKGNIAHGTIIKTSVAFRAKLCSNLLSRAAFRILLKGGGGGKIAVPAYTMYIIVISQGGQTSSKGTANAPLLNVALLSTPFHGGLKVV